jgi:hypothetical protein
MTRLPPTEFVEVTACIGGWQVYTTFHSIADLSFGIFETEHDAQAHADNINTAAERWFVERAKWEGWR